MPRRKRTLPEADPDAQVLASKGSLKGKAKATGASMVTTDTNRADLADRRPTNAASERMDHLNNNTVTQLKFISLCRPHWDVQAEMRDKEIETDDEEDEKDDEQDMCAADCVCKDPANDRPGWTWVVSEAGLEMYKQLEKQAFNRDQDAHGLYIYNDYTAYGINEVVDNWLRDFNKEVSRRTVSPHVVWAQLESMSMFLQLDYIDIWFHGDDCRGFAETIALVGRALLTGLQILKNHELLKPYQPTNGGLRNLSIVLAMFVEFARSWTKIGGDHYGATKWVPRVGRIAKENNIEIKGPYKFHEHNHKILEPEPRKEMTSDERPKEKKKKIHFSEGTWGILTLVDADSDDDEGIYDDEDYSVKGWKKSFRIYADDHVKMCRKIIGGTFYDITKMSKTKKKQFGWNEEQEFSF